MDKKAVFFDADGTVCDIKKGVPESAIEAICRLVTMDMKRGSVPDAAGLLYRGTWNRFLLPG